VKITRSGDSELAGEMNIPANITSLSINNARLADHRRHVFHETFFTSFSLLV
jgi:hypothetical protein